MGIESIILITTSVLVTLKAFFEWRKAKAESIRADNTEAMLKHTLRSIEVAKSNMDKAAQRKFTMHMRQYIMSSECNSDHHHCLVKKVTEGDGDIKAILS